MTSRAREREGTGSNRRVAARLRSARSHPMSERTGERPELDRVTRRQRLSSAGLPERRCSVGASSVAGGVPRPPPGVTGPVTRHAWEDPGARRQRAEYRQSRRIAQRGAFTPVMRHHRPVIAGGGGGNPSARWGRCSAGGADHGLTGGRTGGRLRRCAWCRSRSTPSRPRRCTGRRRRRSRSRADSRRKCLPGWRRPSRSCRRAPRGRGGSPAGGEGGAEARARPAGPACRGPERIAEAGMDASSTRAPEAVSRRTRSGLVPVTRVSRTRPRRRCGSPR